MPAAGMQHHAALHAAHAGLMSESRAAVPWARCECGTTAIHLPALALAVQVPGVPLKYFKVPDSIDKRKVITVLHVLKVVHRVLMSTRSCAGRSVSPKPGLFAGFAQQPP